MSHYSILIRFILFLVVGFSISVPTTAFAKSSIQKLKFERVSAGTARLPNSLQPIDLENGYFEAFQKVGLPIWKSDKAKISVFFRTFFSGDTLMYSYNNRIKLSFGVSYQRQINKNFNIIASLHYDWDYRPYTLRQFTGVRANISYFYYKSRWRNIPENHKGLFRQNAWFKVWGSLTYPESLANGNTNLAFITGGELAMAYVWPKWKLQYVPFVDFIFAVDTYKLSANSKFIPAVGFKFRKSLKDGEATFGIKYAIDHRWTIGTTQTGIVIFSGWYRSF